MGKKLSIQCKAYIGTSPIVAALPAGATAASFGLLKGVKDVKLNKGTKEADTSTRDSFLALTQVALLDLSIDLTMKVDPTNAGITALEDAYWTPGATVSMAFMNDVIATVGARGIAGNWTVTKADEDETLENAVEITYTLKPADEFVGKYVVPSS